MDININAIVKQAKPWDLVVTIDDVKYAIRRLSAADFRQLTDLQKSPVKDQNKFLMDLFEAKKKPTLDNEQGSAVLGVVVAYYQENVIRKNFEAAAAAVQAVAK